MEPYLSEVLWIVILGFILAFILAFGVGANDVANSFATSVGSGVMTFRQACYLASVFEIAGAILLGYKVSDTMRKGILDVKVYEGNEEQLMVGMLCALIGCSIWLLTATYFKLPVSTTHSIVGATVGFGLVSHGADGLNTKTLYTIAASWVISPVMSGLISIALFMAINRFILRANKPFRAGLIALPFVYALVVFINVLSITWDGSKSKQNPLESLIRPLIGQFRICSTPNGQSPAVVGVYDFNFSRGRCRSRRSLLHRSMAEAKDSRRASHQREAIVAGERLQQ
jgi:solute carrier family 20 (sodium-dependent phosphate transporter)